MHRFLAGALALVLASPAYAQNVQSSDTIETEQDDNPSSEIVVTAARFACRLLVSSVWPVKSSASCAAGPPLAVASVAT